MKRIRNNTSLRKKQIIEAARKVAIKYGSENVTIRQIAREVGITEGAIYRHFKSKKELLSGLADDVINSLLQDFIDISSGLSTLDALKFHILAIEKRKGASFQVIAEIISIGNKQLNKKIYSGIKLYIAKLREMLDYDKTNHFKKADNEAASMILFGMIQGLVNLWTLSNYRFDISEMFNRMWNIYTQGTTRLKHYDNSMSGTVSDKQVLHLLDKIDKET